MCLTDVRMFLYLVQLRGLLRLPDLTLTSLCESRRILVTFISFRVAPDKQGAFFVDHECTVNQLMMRNDALRFPSEQHFS